jgi:hypothetical protein
VIVKALPELLWAFVLVAMSLGVRSVWARVRATGAHSGTPEPHLRWLSDDELLELRRLLVRSDPGALPIVDAVIAPRARLLRDGEVERLTAALDRSAPVDMDSDEWLVADDLTSAIQPLSERFWR